MGCGCCKDSAVLEGSSERHQFVQRDPRSPSLPVQLTAIVISPPNRNCRFCGAHVDGCLLESHEEVCRVNHRKKMVPEAPPLPPTNYNMGDVETILCVICLDAHRAVAFVPCGHMCCCASCSGAVSECPLCRQSVRGTLKPTTDMCVCRTCGDTIHPSLFDGHRETCALRRRQAGFDNPTISPLSAAVCVTCQTGKRDRALLPCGHVAFCSTCVGVSACPVCCREVEGVMTIYK